MDFRKIEDALEVASLDEFDPDPDAGLFDELLEEVDEFVEAAVA